MSDRRSFPEAADGRPSLPMEPELWAAGLSLMDARFVARQLARQGFTLTRSDELDALRAENERYREALLKIANGEVPTRAAFWQWHDRYQDQREFARAALETKGTRDE